MDTAQDTYAVAMKLSYENGYMTALTDCMRRLLESNDLEEAKFKLVAMAEKKAL